MPFKAPDHLYANHPTYDGELIEEFKPGSEYTKAVAGLIHTYSFDEMLDTITCKEDPRVYHRFSVRMGETDILNFGALDVKVS